MCMVEWHINSGIARILVKYINSHVKSRNKRKTDKNKYCLDFKCKPKLISGVRYQDSRCILWVL
jgi:hypothetical protein